MTHFGKGLRCNEIDKVLLNKDLIKGDPPSLLRELWRAREKMNEARLDVQLGIFVHHIIELKKGLRDLALHKVDKSLREKIEKKLKREEMAFTIYLLGKNKILVFFGNALCIKMIESFGKKSLKDYTQAEDFILGTMLGYALLPQIERYFEYGAKL